ncbi:MAG: CCA tRNA nucleotidyltransferase [Verrucomicrobiota bacterium]
MQAQGSLIQQAGAVVRKLQDAGHEAYFAGGVVRDKLLGIRAQDVDIATSAHPDQVQELFARATDLQGKAFGVVRVLQDEEVFEVATFRQDLDYQDGRRPEGVVFTTAEEDAQRRDFTVNGLFYDPVADRVIDYIGGQEDLEAGVLRAIGDARQRFEEDHLRLFRAVRFSAQLGFEIEPETWRVICDLSELGGKLAPERVRDELIKCFSGPRPQRALDLLVDSGLMDQWIPEVSKMKGVEQPPEFHPEGDVYTHVHMMVGMLKNADPVVAFSVLLHDIAKPNTYSVDETGRIRFTMHETVGAEMAEEIMRRLRFPNQMVDAVQHCVANHMKFKDALSMRVSTLKRFMSQPYFEQEMELHRIDCSCCHADLSIYDFIRQKQEEFSKEPVMPDPLISGKDLMDLGMQPGPQMGKLLIQIQDEQLEGALKDREQALVRARELIKALTGE